MLTLVRLLLNQGLIPIVLDDLSTGSVDQLAAGCKLYQGDVGDTELVARILACETPQVVIHLAARTSAAASLDHPLDYYDVNMGRTRALLKAIARSGGHPGFIFSSTAAVYGQVESNPVNECHPTAPLTPYGTSKLMAETMLLDVARAHRLKVAILRYFNVVGRAAGTTLSRQAAAPGSLVSIALEAARGERPDMPINGIDHPTLDGTPVRDFIHVDDIAAAHVALLPRLGDPAAPCIYNCGNGVGYSVREVVAAVEALSRRAISRTIVARRPGDPSQVLADATSLRTWTGWRPTRVTLAEMLENSDEARAI